jgi:hypothetical protein
MFKIANHTVTTENSAAPAGRTGGDFAKTKSCECKNNIANAKTISQVVTETKVKVQN